MVVLTDCCSLSEKICILIKAQVEGKDAAVAESLVGISVSVSARPPEESVKLGSGQTQC